MQNAKYIYNFSKKVVIPFERGDIDVRTPHAKPPFFFFTFSNVLRFGHTFFTKNHEKSPVHNFGALQNTLRIAWYIVNVWKNK